MNSEAATWLCIAAVLLFYGAAVWAWSKLEEEERRHRHDL
jgi:hypothetical protein